jgi:hypothetical protein
MGMTGFDVGFDFHSFMKLHSISPLGELLSFACAKESNQRNTHPAIKPFGFLALLNKISGCGTRPNKAYKTCLVAVLEQVLALVLFYLHYSA